VCDYYSQTETAGALIAVDRLSRDDARPIHYSSTMSLLVCIRTVWRFCGPLDESEAKDVDTVTITCTVHTWRDKYSNN